MSTQTSLPGDSPQNHVQLSVIVCTRHRPGLLRRCLPSVCASVRKTTADSELIVVDNGDQPSEEVRGITSDFGGRYFWEPIRGISPARNRGILEAEGEVLAFLDDDVVALEGWAGAVMDNFRDPEVTAVTGSVLAAPAEASSDFVWYELYRPFADLAVTFRESTDIPFFPVTAGLCGIAGNMAFRRSFFFRHGLFDCNLGAGSLCPGNEEVDRFYVCLKAGGAIRFDPAVAVEHSFQGNRKQLLLKITSYAAGQSAYLFKNFFRDPRKVLGFLLHRAFAFASRGDHQRKKLGKLSAPKLPLFLGTLLGPFAYSLSLARERLFPRRTVSLPMTARVRREPGRRTILMVLYNSGLTGVEKMSALIAEGVSKSQNIIAILPSPGPAAANIRSLGVPVGIIPRLRLRATWNPLYQLAYLAALPGTVSAFRRAIAHLSPDLVHVHSLVNVPPMLAARLSGKTSLVLVHVHEIIPGLPGVVLRRLALHLSDRIIAVSEAAARGFPRKSRNTNVFVVYGGVPARPERSYDPVTAEKKAPPCVTFVGRLSHDKGPHLFIKAAKLVQQECPDTRFVLCGLTVPGRRSYERYLCELIHKTDFRPPQFLLERDHDDTANLVCSSSVVVSCSLWPDPFPLAILEAMALSKPVVVPALGGLPEMVVDGETGLLYRPGDAHDLARAILRLVRDPVLSGDYGQKARQRVLQHFSGERVVEAVSRHYEALLSS